MQVAPETGFLRESVGNNEVFSSKNPVSLVGYVNPDYDFLTLYVTTPSLMVVVSEGSFT
ncbi:hypothetical protein [Phormidium nigroviride]